MNSLLFIYALHLSVGSLSLYPVKLKQCLRRKHSKSKSNQIHYPPFAPSKYVIIFTSYSTLMIQYIFLLSPSPFNRKVTFCFLFTISSYSISPSPFKTLTCSSWPHSHLWLLLFPWGYSYLGFSFSQICVLFLKWQSMNKCLQYFRNNNPNIMSHSYYISERGLIYC